jgi:hypothetical protein
VTKITDKLDSSLSIPTARWLAFRITSPVSDGVRKRIRESTEEKPISIFAELNLDQAKYLQRVLAWAIDRMELDTIQEGRLGPSGCVEDNWPQDEYRTHSMKCAAIDERHGMSEI